MDFSHCLCSYIYVHTLRVQVIMEVRSQAVLFPINYHVEGSFLFVSQLPIPEIIT